ncbi:4Fe-4S ferredoxin-type, iron-sulphur binding domain [Moorella glycerini]|uniref:Benzoyl-CoA oxygenase component A n=1 Tax=Neomoorella stamsii TaxID=1266720 RepID=A0A9X7P4Q0_9FIRM|nr:MULTISPECIES: 4Fe-4S binding protein [Moorella]PRR68668.1 Benzoyl-CoA oxygenase component A [Moorella stamsii]CEP68993.1 4Fe-4S ferredoxin-type, iron-sulphur binding domain [Moorella glycerini]
MAVTRIDYEKCNRCGKCWDICPMDVFQRFDREIYIAYRDDCMSCFLCAIECPEGCIEVDGKRARELPFPY